MNREAERKRLVELIENFFEKEIGASFVKGFLDKFADNILDDGWMRPPVKVGDTLYYPKHGNGEIVECEVTQVRIIFSKHKGRTIQIYFNSGNKLSEACFTPIDFKYGFVHYTREDALKALEGSGEK